jgi:hypothetical protein
MSEDNRNQALQALREEYVAASLRFCEVAGRYKRGEASDEELRRARLAENEAREAWQAALKAANIAMPCWVK